MCDYFCSLGGQETNKQLAPVGGNMSAGKLRALPKMATHAGTWGVINMSAGNASFVLGLVLTNMSAGNACSVLSLGV